VSRQTMTRHTPHDAEFAIALVVRDRASQPILANVIGSKWLTTNERPERS